MPGWAACFFVILPPHASESGNADRTLRDTRPPRLRRDGRGLPRPGRAPRPRRRREGAPCLLLSDPDRLRRFELEARATSQLSHPNVLAVFDIGTHEGLPYLVEELLEGETLRQKLAGSPLPIRKAIDYARQTAFGLAAAHQRGIVHRDLKPENVFVTHDGRVKILDFGLAKLLQPEATASELTGMTTRAETEAGVVLGTVGYMSPEQVRGQAADHRSDIFSLGTILYEMVSGRRAFAAGSSVETMNAILKEDPPEISRTNQEVPPGLERILQHCLEKAPDERFQSARDLAFQLEALSSASAATTAVRERQASPRRRTLPLWPAVAAGLVAVAAGFWAGSQSRAPEVPPTYRQLTFRQGNIFSARFAPDGQSVVYAASWDGQPTELFTMRPGSPESRSLGLPPAEVLSISPKGEMALLLNAHYTIGWQRTGTLAQAPFGGGVPRPIAEHVQDADWDPDGASLALARYVEGRCRLEYPIGKVLYETSTWIHSPRVSRDGTRIAFINHPSTGDDRGAIAVVDLAGKVTMLTEAFASANAAAWSPDGKEVWFSAGLTGNVQAIHAVDLGGTVRLVDGAPAAMRLGDVTPAGRTLVMRNMSRRGILALAPGEEVERDLSWLDWSRPGDLSPDGRWLLFDEQGQGGGPGYAVYLRGTDGSPAVRLGAGLSWSLSPDGKWVTALSVSDPHRVFFLPRGAGEARTLDLPSIEIFWIGWLPDGKRLLVSGFEPGKLTRLYVTAENGDGLRPITPEGLGPWGGAVTPDGRQVAVVIGQRPPAFYSIDGGGEPRPIPGSATDDMPLAVTGDGRFLIVGVKERPVARLDRIDLATGQRTLWKRLAPADRAGLLDVSYPLAAPDVGAYVYSYRRVLTTLYEVDGLK